MTKPTATRAISAKAFRAKWDGVDRFAPLATDRDWTPADHQPVARTEAPLPTRGFGAKSFRVKFDGIDRY